MTSEEGLKESDVHNLNKRAGWEGNVTTICKYINCGCGEEGNDLFSVCRVDKE